MHNSPETYSLKNSLIFLMCRRILQTFFLSLKVTACILTTLYARSLLFCSVLFSSVILFSSVLFGSVLFRCVLEIC